MTITTASTTDRNLDTACAAVAGEVPRTDGKVPFAFNGAVLAGLAFLADHHPPAPTEAAGALAVTALTAAAVLLLFVVRPRLNGSDRASFPYWAHLEGDAIRACMTDARPARLRILSIMALRKYRGLRNAIATAP